jgi:hypothetical protein
VSRRIARRFKDPVALVEGSVLGIAGAVVALEGPWPWLALPAGPLIALVVLVIATWPKRVPKPPEAERDVLGLVRHWANALADDHPARARADEAVRLVDGIEQLIFRCEREIGQLDGLAKVAAADRLDGVTRFVTRSVDTYSAPVRASEWSSLAERLGTAQQTLQQDLKLLS